MDTSSEDAFTAFYDATWPRTVACAYAMTGNLGEAEDLAQDPYSRAWSRWSTLRVYDDPGARGYAMWRPGWPCLAGAEPRLPQPSSRAAVTPSPRLLPPSPPPLWSRRSGSYRRRSGGPSSFTISANFRSSR